MLAALQLFYKINQDGLLHASHSRNPKNIRTFADYRPHVLMFFGSKIEMPL